MRKSETVRSVVDFDPSWISLPIRLSSRAPRGMWFSSPAERIAGRDKKSGKVRLSRIPSPDSLRIRSPIQSRRDARANRTRAATRGSGSNPSPSHRRHVNGHRRSLFFKDVSNRCVRILASEERACTAVASPSLSMRFVKSRLVETSARVRFNVSHHSLRGRVRSDNKVNMIRANVRGQQRPVMLDATFNDRGENNVTARMIHSVSVLIHEPPLRA